VCLDEPKNKSSCIGLGAEVTNNFFGDIISYQYHGPKSDVNLISKKVICYSYHIIYP
jgi:hypothetical protein